MPRPGPGAIAGTHMPLRHPAMLIATWLGVGLSPVAPGTGASLVALAIAWPIRVVSGIPGIALAVALVFALGCWAADVVARARRVRDPDVVVVDEIAGQWLVLRAAPTDPLGWGAAFLLFRLFDISKPWPVNWVDRHLKGGLGIMLDDILAAGYAVLVLTATRAVKRALNV
jgi:phosphatidylglycerophosphatase A